MPAEALTPRRLLDQWYATDVDTGAVHLLRLKALPARGVLADALLHDHEDNLFYKGWGIANEPVYNQHATAYLLRDEPEAVVRAFYSYMASAFSHSVFEPVEHRWTHGQYFGPPSTDGAWFELYRNMLVHERDDDVLVLAQATPRAWLRDGQKIELERVPTYYGALSATIESRAAVRRDPRGRRRCRPAATTDDAARPVPASREEAHAVGHRQRPRVEGLRRRRRMGAHSATRRRALRDRRPLLTTVAHERHSNRQDDRRVKAATRDRIAAAAIDRRATRGATNAARPRHARVIQEDDMSTLRHLIISAVLVLTSFVRRSWRRSAPRAPSSARSPTRPSAALPGATVTVTNLDTGLAQTAVTDAGGNFEILALPIGSYSVTVTMHGFKTWRLERRRAHRRRSQPRRRPCSKSARSPRRSRWKAARRCCRPSAARCRRSIQMEQIRELPLSTRNPVALVNLVPGMRSPASGGPERGSTVQGFGLRGNQTEFQLDGLNANAAMDEGGITIPNVDTIAEFSVETSSFSAENGRNPLQVVMATKSGTNAFNGTAWEFVQNDKLNARNAFSAAQPAEAATQPVRRRDRRPGRAQPDVLLRQLRGHADPPRDPLQLGRAPAGDAAGRLLRPVARDHAIR